MDGALERSRTGASFALWEEPTRTVFCWKVPGMTPAGGRCDHAIDYLTIYQHTASSRVAGSRTFGRQVAGTVAKIAASRLGQLCGDNAWLPKPHRPYRRLAIYRYADGSEELYYNKEDALERKKSRGRSGLRDHQSRSENQATPTERKGFARGPD